MNVLGMFARRPEPGRTKTRLAAAIGNAAAADLYAAFVQDLLQRLPACADRLVVAVTPAGPQTEQWFRPHLAPSTELTFQPEGDLGDRIEFFFQAEFQKGAKRIVLVGSDSPDLPPQIVAKAFERLNAVDVVLSPAGDGGFVLIGLRQRPSGLFHDIPWSSSTTLLDTMAAVHRHGLSVELLQPWYDIDVAPNLGTFRRLQAALDSGAARCPATVTALDRHWDAISPVADLL